MKVAVFTVALLTGFMLSGQSVAQNVSSNIGYAGLRNLPVPVIEGDITDRPYRVIGHINAGVHKATIFSGGVSHDKVMRELWERGRKLGADAVIHASYGESHITAMSWGAREIRGEAIKFLSDEEISAVPTHTPLVAPVNSSPSIEPR